MKKINSVWYGAKILAAGVAVTALIPLVLYLSGKIFGETVLFSLLSKISGAIGAAILVFFFAMLAVELHQDKKAGLLYNSIKYRKTRLQGDLYECQHCGSRQVQKTDTYCKACGIKFLKEAQNIRD